MKALKISDSEAMVMALQDEIRRSEQSRYDHRLHGVLLVAQGMTCPQVAALLGDAARTVEYWVRGFERDGLAALVENERSGRRARLDDAQLEIVAAVLRETPEAVGLAGNLWDGKRPLRVSQGALWSGFAGASMPEALSPSGFPSPQAAPGGRQSRSAASSRA